MARFRTVPEDVDARRVPAPGFIDTPAGKTYVGPGDWIVTTRRGDLTVWKNGEFRDRFAPLDKLARMELNRPN